MPPYDEPAKLETFRDHALSQPSAIEDLEDLGRRLHTCTWTSRSDLDASGPYYGSRKAIRSAQLVAMPYQLLLSTTARDALGIDLAGQIVVIDEAHALIDTVLGTHSVTVSAANLSQAVGALRIYQQRFANVLKGSNAAFLKQLVAVLARLERYCADAATKAGGKALDEMRSAADLVRDCAMDQTNFHALDGWIREAKMARKVRESSEAALIA